MSEATSGETALFHCKIALSHVDLTSLKVMTLLIKKKWLYTTVMLKDIEARGGEKGSAWAKGSRAAGQEETQHGWEPVPRERKGN